MKAILGYVLAVIFLVIAGIFFFQQLKKGKDVKYWKAQFEACRDAPVKTDTIRPAKVKISLPVQHPVSHSAEKITKSQNKPVSGDLTKAVPVQVVDTTCQENLYSDSVASEEVVIFYTAHTIGALDWIKHDYRLKVPREIRTTRTIYEPKEIPTETPRSHLYAFCNIGYDFANLNAPEIGLQWNYKTFWGIMVSYEYAGRSNIKGGFIFKLK